MMRLSLTAFVRGYNTGLLLDCEEEGKVLPSIESFEQRWKVPKVGYIFHEYCLKPVIGETKWNRRLDENQRLAPMMTEAFVLAELANNYHPWVYDFKTLNPNTTLKTEYDEDVLTVLLQEGEQGEGEEQQRQDEEELELFCGDLDMIEVSVPTPPVAAPNGNANEGGTNGQGQEEQQDARDHQDFTVLSQLNANAGPYQEARDRNKAIMRGIREQLVLDREQQRVGSHVALYVAVKAKLIADASQPVTSPAETRKRKLRVKREMKSLTKQCKKPKKGNNRLKGGWTDQGIQYVQRMMQRIRRDEESGIRLKWEAAYKKLIESVKQIEAAEEEEAESVPIEWEMMLVEV